MCFKYRNDLLRVYQHRKDLKLKQRDKGWFQNSLGLFPVVL